MSAEVDCPAPDVANAIVIDGNSPPYGYKSFLTYKCKTGFEINGANSITCEIESEWNPPIPECKKGKVSIHLIAISCLSSCFGWLLPVSL